jgi:hypothetical protein
MKQCLVAFVVFYGLAAATTAAEKTSSLAWDPARGAVVTTPWATVHFDCNDFIPSLFLRVKSGPIPLNSPRVTHAPDGQLKLAYEAKLPDGVTLALQRELKFARTEGQAELIETFHITPDKPVTADLEIERPFAIIGPDAGATPSALCPLFNGWARPYPLSSQLLSLEYQLANCIGGEGRLALPAVQLDGKDAWRAAVTSDCRFSTRFTFGATGGNKLQGSLRYRYACSKVPLCGTETRSFGLWLTPAPPATEPFGRSIDAFYRLMLPDVPPGPEWLHDIAMVHYDYLSENGQGWEKDVNELAKLLKPEERRRTALCFHGWYETIGGYSLDPATGKIKNQWTAMARTRKVHLTREEMKRRLGLARSLGFRVLLYFGDGLLQDSGAPFAGCYNADWDYQGPDGNRVTGWQGPDTWGKTYARNPAHPDVVKWYSRYLAALLDAFADVLDGLVWDETYYVGLGRIAAKPEPAYCDRAMLDLVRLLTHQVRTADPQKAFLVSDCLGEPGSASYAMVADGTYQDTACKPSAWSYGLFPNWRNTLWSCNWGAVSKFSWTKWGTEDLGTPVAISNGWGDDQGPHEWTPEHRQAVLDLFRQRLAKKDRVRFLASDPSALLADAPGLRPPSDPIPAAAPGEVNWALASAGAKAKASSESVEDDTRYPAAGVIDGVRTDAGWGQGHGWASRAREPLPQWIEVAFSAPRSIERFVVITYGTATDPSSTEVWGVKRYDIEVWDDAANAWKTVVSEPGRQMKMARVHKLETPARLSKFRVVVRDVAPNDKRARLLQVEAWGRP